MYVILSQYEFCVIVVFSRPRPRLSLMDCALHVTVYLSVDTWRREAKRHSTNSWGIAKEKTALNTLYKSQIQAQKPPQVM